MKAATYAHAITRLIEAGNDEKKLGDTLVAHLQESGRMKLLPGILAELKASGARNASIAPSVEVAHEHDAHAALTSAKAGGIDAPKAHVNHTLLSGWRARNKGTLIDRSGKRALIDLYRKIANA